jgi:hypothetical protein
MQRDLYVLRFLKTVKGNKKKKEKYIYKKVNSYYYK